MPRSALALSFLAGTLLAGLAGPAAAQSWDAGSRIIAVRAPGVSAAPDPAAPSEPNDGFGSALADPRLYLQIDHPLYRLYVRRLEQVGRWDLDPLEAPEGLNTGNFVAFLRNAREKYGQKLQSLIAKPDRTFRFKGEQVKAGMVGKLLRSSYIVDPHWTTGYAKGSVGIKLVSRIFDVETGAKLAELTEASTVSVQTAGLVESMTDLESAEFEAKLDYRGRKELQLGKEIFPEGSPQIQQAVGRQALAEGDDLVRRVVSRTKDVDAFKLRGFITEIPSDQVRFGLGQAAEVNVDGAFWVLKRSRRDGLTVEENVGYVKVRDLDRTSSLAQPIAQAQGFSTGDAVLHIPTLGLAASARALVNPLAFLPATLPNTYATASITPETAFPVPFMVSLPIELDLAPLFRSPMLSETYLVLEPAFGMRRTAQDIGGTLGGRRRFYLNQLAITPGLKAGVIYSTLKLGKLDAAADITDSEDASIVLDTAPINSLLAATQLGISVGPEVALDYQFHPNFSAGVYLDFLYTYGLAPTVRAADVQTPLTLIDFKLSDPEQGDVDLRPNAVQMLRLGTGLHATLLF